MAMNSYLCTKCIQVAIYHYRSPLLTVRLYIAIAKLLNLIMTTDLTLIMTINFNLIITADLNPIMTTGLNWYLRFLIINTHTTFPKYIVTSLMIW